MIKKERFFVLKPLRYVGFCWCKLLEYLVVKWPLVVHIWRLTIVVLGNKKNNGFQRMLIRSQQGDNYAKIPMKGGS